MNVSLPRDKTKTVSNTLGGKTLESARVVDGRNLGEPPNRVVVSPSPAIVPETKDGNATSEVRGLNGRQLTFRCIRLTLAGALVSYAVAYTRNALTTARSEQAYINAEITALRAPIGGVVRLEPFGSGRTLRAGTELFSIQNVRFGNEQALSQLNWVSELAQRLRAEADEATVRFGRQKEVTELHEKMYAEKILPRLELLEEQSKLVIAGTILTNKVTLAEKAEERAAELKMQAELQQRAVVTMPFDGIAWAIPARNGAQLSVHETVAEIINPKQIWVDAFFHERHADKLALGSELEVQTPHGEFLGRGTVESVRGGVGRIPYEGVAAVNPGEYTQRRIAVRVKLEFGTPFDASQFFGVGRSVVVTLSNHE